MEIKIGDRFKYVTNGGTYNIWEYSGRFTIIESNTPGMLGHSTEDLDINSYYQYLGNFSKVDKFEELYNLMNS